MNRTVWVVLSLVAGMGAGCGDDGGTDPDGGPARCGADIDCSDGLYCNGVELCAPASLEADVRGCVAGDAPECGDGSMCDETADRCGLVCDVEPDGDGDGAIATACGGDDCDDSDPERFPGNTEICDADDRDEDCDPTTFGQTSSSPSSARARSPSNRYAASPAASTPRTPAPSPRDAACSAGATTPLDSWAPS